MSKNTTQHKSPRKTEWDLKRVLSTTFVIFICALLILFFMFSDLSTSCDGSGRSQKGAVLAKVDGNRISIGDEALGRRIQQLQERDHDATHESVVRQALDSLVWEQVLLKAVRESGATLSDETRRAILYRYLQEAQVDPRQFAAYDRAYRQSVESSLNSDHLKNAFQADILSSARSTRLALQIDSEIEAIKNSIELVRVDIRALADSKLPKNDELKAWFEKTKSQGGGEAWKRAASFEKLNDANKKALLESWKKVNYAPLVMSVNQDSLTKLKAIEDSVKAGTAFAAAAQASGLPVVTTDYFAHGEMPKAGGTDLAIDSRDFHNQVLTLAAGAVSGVIQTPTSVLIFRLRDRKVVPDADLALASDKAAFEKLPQDRQETVRTALRGKLELLNRRLKYALVQDVFTDFYNRAGVTINEKNLGKEM